MVGRILNVSSRLGKKERVIYMQNKIDNNCLTIITLSGQFVVFFFSDSRTTVVKKVDRVSADNQLKTLQ